MKKQKLDLKNIGLIILAGFAWSKLGLGAAVKEIVVNNDIIPIGTTVEYIPLGKQSWRDAETGIVTGTLEAGAPGVVTHYQINDAFNILVAFVRRV